MVAMVRPKFVALVVRLRHAEDLSHTLSNKAL